MRLSFGKAAEMQRRAVVHFHAIIRLDGSTRTTRRDPAAPAGIDAADLVAASTTPPAPSGSPPHRIPRRPDGWRIGWGEQVLTKVITVAAEGQVTDAQVAAYLAKVRHQIHRDHRHTSARLTDETVAVYADPDGTHTERLVEACWILGQPRQWRRLRHWAHMLGFGGHFLTKSRRYSITFALLRNGRIEFRRTHTAGPEPTGLAEAPTTLVVNFLQFVGAGWHTTADAILANTERRNGTENTSKPPGRPYRPWPRERPSTVKPALTPNRRGAAGA
jgi:hypothetical protein